MRFCVKDRAMVYAISILLVPLLTVLMAVNVIRIIKIVGKYGFDLFKTGRGPTAIEITKIKSMSFTFLEYVGFYCLRLYNGLYQAINASLGPVVWANNKLRKPRMLAFAKTEKQGTGYVACAQSRI